MTRSVEVCASGTESLETVRAERDALRALLLELIDIEGPQPGHVMWFRKVQAALGIRTDETKSHPEKDPDAYIATLDEGRAWPQAENE